MKLLICGSRKVEKFDLSPHVHEGTTMIISGGAKGIDAIAEEYAKNHNIPTTIVRPDYARYGRGAAPLKRNREMVDMADAVLAIWDSKSSGTKHTIEYAEKTNTPVTVITVSDGE